MVMLMGWDRAGEGPKRLHSPNIPALLCRCSGAHPELVPTQSREKPHRETQRIWLSLEKLCKLGL